jgi:HEAT repeat protein
MWCAGRIHWLQLDIALFRIAPSFVVDHLAAYTTEPHSSIAAQELLSSLDSADPAVRSGAASALGDLKYDPAVPVLIKLLSDPTDYVVAEAAMALGDMRATSGFDHVVGVLTSDTRLVARAGAAEALGLYSNRRAFAVLSETALHDPSSYVRRAAVYGLAKMPGPATNDVLRRVATRNDIAGRAAQRIMAGGAQ